MRPVIKGFELLRSGEAFFIKVKIELKSREEGNLSGRKNVFCEDSFMERSMVNTEEMKEEWFKMARVR